MPGRSSLLHCCYLLHCCSVLLFNVVIIGQTKQLSPKEFLRILDEKLEKKLKPISLTLNGLANSVAFMSEKFESMVQRIDNVEAKCSVVEEENKRLKAEVLRLTKIAERHEGEINDLQQYSRRESVEMAGLPHEKEENTDELVIKVGSLMGLILQKTNKSISHRLPQNTQKYSSRLRPREGARTTLSINFPRLLLNLLEERQRRSSAKQERSFSTRQRKILDLLDY